MTLVGQPARQLEPRGQPARDGGSFLVQYDDIDGVYSGDGQHGASGALNGRPLAAGGRAGRTSPFVGADELRPVGYERDGAWRNTGARSTSRPVDDAEAALQTALDILAGEDAAGDSCSTTSDTPKITPTQDKHVRLRPRPVFLILLAPDPGAAPSWWRPPLFTRRCPRGSIEKGNCLVGEPRVV